MSSVEPNFLGVYAVFAVFFIVICLHFYLKWKDRRDAQYEWDSAEEEQARGRICRESEPVEIRNYTIPEMDSEAECLAVARLAVQSRGTVIAHRQEDGTILANSVEKD